MQIFTIFIIFSPILTMLFETVETETFRNLAELIYLEKVSHKWSLGCRLLCEPAPGISTNLDFLSLGKLYANINFPFTILEL